MAYTPLFQTTDTIAVGSHLNSGETSCTLTSGNFATPTGLQLYVVDYGIPGTAEIISASVAGTAMTSITRGLAGGAAGTTNHAASATVGSLWVPQFLGNGLGGIASNDAPTTWAPTYSGSGSLTYTGVTTTIAKYMQLGKMVFFDLEATGTTGGTTNNQLFFTLPVTAASTAGTLAASFDDSGAGGGFALFNSTSQIGVIKYNAGNYTLGTARVIRCSGVYFAA